MAQIISVVLGSFGASFSLGAAFFLEFSTVCWGSRGPALGTPQQACRLWPADCGLGWCGLDLREGRCSAQDRYRGLHILPMACPDRNTRPVRASGARGHAKTYRKGLKHGGFFAEFSQSAFEFSKGSGRAHRALRSSGPAQSSIFVDSDVLVGRKCVLKGATPPRPPRTVKEGKDFVGM